MRFFNKTRKALITSNKIQKYLLYALGEIALVIIGILIALQINNINGSKKDKTFEVEMLKGIKEDLIFTEFLFNTYKDRLHQVDSTMTLLAIASKQEKHSLDSITPLFYFLGMDIEFNYPKGSYEALKATGMDKVTNDSLRYSLYHVYDFWFPFIEGLLDVDKEILMPSYSWTIFFNHEILLAENGTKPTYKLIPIDGNNILSNQKFIKYITSKQEAARNSTGRMDRVMAEMKKLKIILDKELQKY